MKAKSWYKSLGIPYRRGYLFYGPPGCGKSSFIKVLAGYFNLGICLVNLNSRDISDDNLNVLMNEAPSKSIIVIEDIDAAMASRDEDGESVTNGKHNRNLTLSGLLNALDGIASQEGRLIFMTTNKKQHLDPALLRPGRVDRKAYFGLASHAQITEMFRLFFPDVKLTEEFTAKIPANKFSMAEIQKYLMFFRENPQGALFYASKIAEISEDGDICTDRNLSLTDDIDWFNTK